MFKKYQQYQSFPIHLGAPHSEKTGNERLCLLCILDIVEWAVGLLTGQMGKDKGLRGTSRLNRIGWMKERKELLDNPLKKRYRRVGRKEAYYRKGDNNNVDYANYKNKNLIHNSKDMNAKLI